MDWKPFAIFKDNNGVFENDDVPKSESIICNCEDNTVGSLFLDDSLEREFDRRKNVKLAAELHLS